MFGEALAIYRRRFGALVLTCALALVPANLLMSGTVLIGLAGMGAAGVGEAGTHTEQVQEKTRDLKESPPASPEERNARVNQLGREAFEGGSVFDAGLLRHAVPLAYAVLIVVTILLAGIALAHAAVVPLVLGGALGPAGAWATVASRLRELGRTAILGAPLVGLASLFCIVPGIIAAVGFSLAIPAAMSERLGGKAALQRSWNLLRGHWPMAVAAWALMAIFTVAASMASMLVAPGPWRSVVSGCVRLVTYPFPLVVLVLLYRKAVSTSAGSPRLDSSARGSPGT
ncbi:MAG: hypothetical protein ABR567_01290 [Myxococcales bacterium]|nr:hypothetical protein [Myxococcales bacterium]